MNHRQGKILGGDKVELVWQAWLPEKAKAAVAVIHGFGEHSGRYQNVVDKLVPAGYAVWAMDHRGHGRSGGQRGYVDRFEQYISDYHAFCTEVVHPNSSGLPLFVLGHSMGSIIAMNFVAQYWRELAGCILSGTGSASPVGSPLLKAATAVLSRLMPRKAIKFPLPPEFISSDATVVQQYKDDPLVHDQVSFRLAHEMGCALKRGVRAISQVDIPFLIQCGSEDQSFVGQEDLYAGLGTKDKTLKIYQGLKHEVYNELEPERAIVMKDLLSWLEERTKNHLG